MPSTGSSTCSSLCPSLLPTNKRDRPLPNEPLHHAVHLGSDALHHAIPASPAIHPICCLRFWENPSGYGLQVRRGKLLCPSSNHQPRHLSGHTARATCKQGRRHHKSPINCPVTASRSHRRFAPITSNPSHRGVLGNNILSAPSSHQRHPPLVLRKLPSNVSITSARCTCPLSYR